MTVARWRSQGWRPLNEEPRHPLEIARDLLDDALPVLTGDPMTTSTSFVQESGHREALERLSDQELLGRAAREALIAVAVLARAMTLKATLVVTRPAEIGLLVRALAECLRAATPVLARHPE
jgi:hypothetical protein